MTTVPPTAKLPAAAGPAEAGVNRVLQRDSPRRRTPQFSPWHGLLSRGRARSRTGLAGPRDPDRGSVRARFVHRRRGTAGRDRADRPHHQPRGQRRDRSPATYVSSGHARESSRPRAGPRVPRDQLVVSVAVTGVDHDPVLPALSRARTRNSVPSCAAEVVLVRVVLSRTVVQAPPGCRRARSRRSFWSAA